MNNYTRLTSTVLKILMKTENSNFQQFIIADNSIANVSVALKSMYNREHFGNLTELLRNFFDVDCNSDHTVRFFKSVHGHIVSATPWPISF